MRPLVRSGTMRAAGDADTSVYGTGVAGRYALIKVRDGAVLADGDEVFGGRDAALEAFGRARALGWDLYATPDLLADLRGDLQAGPLADPLADGADRGVGALDVSGLAPGPEIALRRVPFTRFRRGGLALLLLLPAVAGAALAWWHRDTLLGWIVGPAPVAAVAPPAEPDLPVAVDSAALIEACRRVAIAYPPWLPAWRIESLSCAARFADPDLAALRPELAGRAVMLVRWRLAPGHAEPLHRQLAERHLSHWYAASVVAARAWAVQPLAPVLRIAQDAPPRFLALRRAIDRSFGSSGARIVYARVAKGAWTVRIDHPGPLSRLADLIRRSGDLAGFEITGLDRTGDGRWRVLGRPVAPMAMAPARYRELTRIPKRGVPERGVPAPGIPTPGIPTLGARAPGAERNFERGPEQPGPEQRRPERSGPERSGPEHGGER